MDVRALATDLLGRWGELDEEARLIALKEIEGRAWLLESGAAETPGLEPMDSLTSLTKRELEVLQALAEVGSTANAAAKLHISSSTVRSHVKSILAKLGMHSRIEAVAFALRHHLIPPSLSPPRMMSSRKPWSGARKSNAVSSPRERVDQPREELGVQVQDPVRASQWGPSGHLRRREGRLIQRLAPVDFGAGLRTSTSEMEAPVSNNGSGAARGPAAA